MIRVGLTGGCCTGKSTVAEMFSRLGAVVVSADRIVHRLLREDEQVKSGVVSVLGEQVLAADGSVDRDKLADIVFSDKKSLTSLTDLLYPKVRLEIRRVFEVADTRRAHHICVAEVPLLIEGGALDLYDAIVVVTANYQNQLRRHFRKGGKSKNDLDRRIRNQTDLAEKIKVADYVVDNDGSLDQTFEQVKNIYHDIRLRKWQTPHASSRLVTRAQPGSENNNRKTISQK